MIPLLSPTRLPLNALRAATLALASLAAAPVLAEGALFLQLDKIPGESTDSLHKDWIDASGLQFSATAATSWLKGSGVAVGKAQPSDIGWQQGWDRSFAGLAGRILTGSAVSTGKFEWVAPNGGQSKPKPTLTLETKGLFLTSLGTSMAGVSVSGTAKEITLSVDPAAQGQTGKAVSTTWNVVDNTVSTTGARTAPSVVGTHAAASGDETRAYLRLGSVAGDSRAVGYENWIEVDATAWNITAETSWLKGTGASVGKPQPGALSWVQSLDATLPTALNNLVKGVAIPELTLEYVKSTGNGGPVTFMQQVMREAYFTEVALSGDAVTESVVFKSFTQTVWSVDAGTGRRGKATTFNQDFTTGKFAMGGALAATVANFGEGMLDGRPFVPGTASSGAVLPGGAVVLVPEPQSWALMLAGGALLAGLARRRRPPA